MANTTLQLINFQTPKQIAEYWETLGALDLQYHLDDDPADIFNSHDQKETILKNHQSLWQFCNKAGVDPWNHI